MLVEFDNISDTSRTWIYSSPISLNNENQDSETEQFPL